MNYILYTKLKWIFVRFSLFAPHTNPHFWTDRTTHDVTSASTFCHLFRLLPPFQRHISLAGWLHRPASAHTHVRVYVANTRVYMRPSSGRFCTCFVLSAWSRVCVRVHRRVVTYSGNFLLRYSHGTFFCNILNALRRLRPLTCVCVCVCVPMSLNPHVVTSFGPFHLRYCNTFPLTHLYSLQHSLLLMLALSLLWSSFSLYQEITRNW